MRRTPTVSVVGAGRVGGAIGLALARNGYELTAAWSLSRAGRDRAAKLLNVPILEPDEACAAADIVVIGVPDDMTSEVAKRVAPGARRGKHVFHTSGGVSVGSLDAIAQKGAHVASLHPLQTIADPVSGADALSGAAVAVTCEPRDRSAYYRIARAWGGRPFMLADEDKAAYHAAAVFASNYVMTSIWAATELFKAVGVNNGLPLLAPLIRTTTDNVIARGPAKAMTGPVARGDMNTVKRHIAELKDRDPTGASIANAYRALAQLTSALVHPS